MTEVGAEDGWQGKTLTTKIVGSPQHVLYRKVQQLPVVDTVLAWAAVRSDDVDEVLGIELASSCVRNASGGNLDALSEDFTTLLSNCVTAALEKCKTDTAIDNQKLVSGASDCIHGLIGHVAVRNLDKDVRLIGGTLKEHAVGHFTVKMVRWDEISSNRHAGDFKLPVLVDRCCHADLSRSHVEPHVAVILVWCPRDGKTDAAVRHMSLRLHYLPGNLRCGLGRI